MTLATTAIAERNIAAIATLSDIPIAFRVDREFEVGRLDDGRLTLVETPVRHPFIKDYDQIDGNAPADWAEHFDLANWGWLTTAAGGQDVGSVLVALDTPDLDLLEGRRDMAAIWDIRIRPAQRGQGVGGRLMRAAESWARARGCRELKVETQSNNVAACRFYSKSGFRLREADADAYPEFPNETQLIWTKPLARMAA